MTINERGGPAFPTEFARSNWLGMTALDYMAAAALTGIMSKYDMSNREDVRKVATFAYAVAHEMVKIGNKLSENPCPEVDPQL